MVEIRYQEWEDTNKYNAYPFSDTSTFRTLTNDVVLKYGFQDASIHIIGGVPPFYIKEIIALDDGVSAEIRIADSRVGSRPRYSAYGIINIADVDETVRLLDTYGRDSGILLMSAEFKNDVIALAKETDLRFRPTALEFVANTCIPLPEVGFRGFILPDGTIVSGSIVFAGENGVVLNDDNDSIRIDIVGDPYYARNCLNDQNIPVDPMCAIKTINGIAPDINGDFKLTSGGYNASDTALRVYPVEGGIQIALLS